ncbi:LOW QUALITY PROTEIN: uncharacterized protein LOC115010921 [Cottoperca gobio]|uniref:LOW QUALITY PROTEIN: uncharacterized protein LOC115010921 n=1 Tax=Cottoperca gobio TaxID=56716 RepID=A0A6J2Q362_COTGO|nr:LOW QUALITY PROTEIN: interleukin-17 receptor E [Cottoperca gobio]
MFKSRFDTALVFIAVLVSPLLLQCTTTTCQKDKGGNVNDVVEGHCPVKLTSATSREPGGHYSECVTVRVWIKADDFCKAPVIEILSTIREIIRPTMKKIPKKCKNKRKPGEKHVHCGTPPQSDASSALWELVHDCVNAKATSVVTASYITTSTRCSVSYTVPDPIPDFDLSVNQSSKSFSVTVEPGDKVQVRWCYQQDVGYCIGGALSPEITIAPSGSRSALLNIPYVLPCVCVQVYYARIDSRRHTKCPLQNKSLADVRDVWLSSQVTLYESSLEWSSECPASDLKISASLCWRQHEHLCTPVLNFTLEEKEERPNLIYDTSAVDKHPQMCVQFSLEGSHNISCPFQADMSSWEVYIGLSRQSVFLYLSSFVPAKFSAQLCVLDKRGCTPMGQVLLSDNGKHTVCVCEGNTTKTRLNVPLHFLAEKPCVQVWQSNPVLHGRRILCPDYTHDRRGMYAVAALVLVVVVALLGIFIHRFTKSRAAGWLCIQEPVLLVCSSEQSAHISAVCALASILQGELSAAVHMALCSQSSQTGTGTGVADLGPLPWLYGQWEAVLKAQGKVLIIWSPEATEAYENWREERANVDESERKMRDYSKAEAEIKVEEDSKLNERRLVNCKKEKAAGKKHVNLCDDKDWCTQREPSTVIAPVFKAALACLEGALQECKGQGVVLVYFQGFCHSRDIPKAFRGVPRFCLPQDFSGLTQELGGRRRETQTGNFRWHCLPRLLSKVLSIWLARQLSQRLQTLLPQTQGKKKQWPSATSSRNMMSDKTQSKLKLPLAANMVRPGTVQEHEPLHVSPW